VDLVFGKPLKGPIFGMGKATSNLVHNKY